MKTLFWIPCKIDNLIHVVWHFERKPFIATASYTEEALAGHAEVLTDWFKDRAIRSFKKTDRPQFRAGHAVGKGYMPSLRRGQSGKWIYTEQIVQPLDRRSVYFFLGCWDLHGGARTIFSGEGRIDEFANIVAIYDDLYSEGEEFETSALEFVKRWRFVILLDALFDIDNGVVILSQDEDLLQRMFDYLMFLGEDGFIYDGSAEAKERRRRMARKEPGGVYLDEFPKGFVYWETGRSE